MTRSSSKKKISTFEKEMESPSFRAALEKEEAALELSEFLARQMAEQELSVRKLAALAAVSPTIIQGIRTGARNNIEYSTLKAIMVALGCEITFRKARKS
ncbi:MAG: helix-turn-helix domain-containing protein [Rectinemataceae bacterium]